MKARSKLVGIIGIVAIVLFVAIILVVDILCATYSQLITLYFRGDVETSYEVSQDDAFKASNDFTVREEAEGLVMLKNDENLLPLKDVKSVSLLGALSAKQLFMGTGSAGGFNWSAEDFLSLKDALAEKNIAIDESLWNYYAGQEGSAGEVAGGVTDMQGSTHSIVDPDPSDSTYKGLLDASAAKNDTAIVVVGRAGGEGSDAVMDMSPYEATGRGGVTQYNQGGEAGKNYLELMANESALIEYAKTNFKNVILLVNSPMAMELGFVDEDNNTTADTVGDIDAALWIGLPGSTGNRGVVQVLTGEVSPSGRLPDTWAKEIESAPSYYNFGNYNYDLSGVQGNAGEQIKYVHYEESIYVGYRWYETANAENVTLTGIGNYQYQNKDATNAHLTSDNAGGYVGAEQKTFNFGDYDSVVQYAFGTGMSYADFDIAFASEPTFDEASNEYVFSVKVTNTDDTYSSKTPVEIYVEQPYNRSAAKPIEKSKVMLAGFGKTGEIAPGASETIEIRVNRDYIASYDYDNRSGKAEDGAYILEAGDYKFYADWGLNGSHCWSTVSSDTAVGTNADTLMWTYTLASDIVFDENNKRPGDLVAATNKFDDVNIGDGDYVPTENDMSRKNLAGTFPAVSGSEKGYYTNQNMKINQETYDRMNDNVHGAVLQGYDPENYEYTGEFADANGNYKDPTSGYDALPTGQSGDLTVADLTGVPYDSEEWDSLISQMSYADLQKLIGYCGWSNPSIRSIGKNSAVDMDGCHGLHDLTSGIEANCFTTTPILAASFNRALAYEFGSTYADECLANGVTGMYGLSMNMHRSPLGGRNFEYYSEDSLLSGYMAASATSGLQDKGVAVYSKHYAVNDQETNRSSLHTWASEQTLREIYLRVYEILTKEATVAGSEVLTGNTGFMTGMNFIGTSHTTSHYSLCTAVPRGEWGFMGRIVTDAESFNNTMSCAVRAGTDMILSPRARTFGDNASDVIAGVDSSKGYGLMKAQEAAKHQLFVFANTAGVSIESGLSTAWVALPVVISIVLALGAIVIFIFMVFPAFFVKKNKAEEQKA